MIDFREAMSYPHLDSLHLFAPRAEDIIRQELKGDWDAYGRIIKELGGLTEDLSYIGGYPFWDQDHASYAPLDFFATIASDDEAQLMFGDCGHANLFITAAGNDVPLMIVQGS